jgi:hypothetical protein
MSDDEKTSPGEPGPLENLFDAFDFLSNAFEKIKEPDPTGRPVSLWVRWRKLETGGVEITSCTAMQLSEIPLADGEHEGKFK